MKKLKKLKHLRKLKKLLPLKETNARKKLRRAAQKRIERKTPYPVGFEYKKERQ